MDEYIERELALMKIMQDGCLASNIAVLKSIPAADVEPVRYEKWDENGRCTGCGCHAPFYAMATTYYKSPYCFECGAKMDGDTE